MAVDEDGNVYVADWANHLIRRITPGGVVSTIAGSAGHAGSTDDTDTTTALFNDPAGMAVDKDGNVYVADQGNHLIRRITPGGVVNTIAGSAGQAGSTDDTDTTTALLNNPYGMAVDEDGNVYVADQGNHLIRRITPEGVVSTIAGSAGHAGSTDGTDTTTAQFKWPSGVAVDKDGNVYVADQGNHLIRKIEYK